MRTFLTGQALACLCLASFGYAAAPVSGPIINPVNGHTYYLLGPDTWTGSEASAEALGGTLATVRDDAENTWLHSTFTPLSQTNLWIGLTDPTHDTTVGSHPRKFVWVSGEAATYRNWAIGEPNNNETNSWYALLQYQQYNVVAPKKWNDVMNVQGETHGVAEIVPEPTSLAMFGLSAGMMLRRRRRMR